VNIIGARTYAVGDYIEDLEAVVLFATDGDRTEFWIVARRGGGELRSVRARACTRHQRFATADFARTHATTSSPCGASWQRRSQELTWRPSRRADAGVTWKGARRSHRIPAAKASSPRTLERRINDATWTRVR
jgi:hypothetical protein